MVGTRGWGKGNGDLMLNEYRVLILQDEIVLEVGCATMSVYLTPLNSTRKDG